MNIQEQFFQELFETMKQQPLPSGMEWKAVEVPKNGGHRKGIAMIGNPTDLVSVAYPDEYVQKWQEGMPIKAIAGEISRNLLGHAEPLTFDRDSLLKQITPEHLRTGVVSYEPNKEWLKETPYERLADLAVYGKIDLGDASVKVSGQVLSMLHMTREEMLDCAKQNTRKQVSLDSLNNVMFQMMKKSGISPEMAQAMIGKSKIPDFMVLTTKDRNEGASLIANTRLMKAIHQKLGEDFYILPSSIHEVLLVGKSEFPDSEEVLKKMVQGVNRSKVAPEERLSDEVYKFDGRSIRLAGSGGLERDPDHMEPLTHRHSRSF